MKVYIVGHDNLIERMFLKRGIETVSHFSEADLVCFTGGSDVTPSLYDEKNVASGNDWLRDVHEMAEYNEAQEYGIPCVGICRGGQFLNVMNGGKMWQDINHHAIWGTHEMYLLDDPAKKFSVTSTHHQMMRKADNGILLGAANLCTKFVHDGTDPAPVLDTEIVWYPETKCLCFQPHPEYNGDKDHTEELFFKLLNEYGLVA